MNTRSPDAKHGIQPTAMSIPTGAVYSSLSESYIRALIARGILPHVRVPMGYMAPEFEKLMTGNPERFVFQIKTRPGWGRREALCRDDRAIHQHFLRPAAKALGFQFEGFGFHSLRREAITAITREVGIEQAMHLAGHTKLDMTLVYELIDHEQQNKGVKAYQERILGKPEGGIQ